MNNNKIKDGDAMSGNQPMSAMRRRKTKTAVWLGIAGLCATGASFIPLPGTTQAATTTESEGMVCTSNPTTVSGVGHETFDLTADDLYTSEPDGNAIYDWGYANSGEHKAVQLPGPVLCVNQGEQVDITLHNNLKVNTSIQFPGQEGVTSQLPAAPVIPAGPVADANGNLTSLVQDIAPGGSVTYSFKANNAGTYVYESGSDPQLQVQMGLFGAIVVAPTYHGLPIAITPDDLLNIPADGPTGVTTNAARGMTSSPSGGSIATYGVLADAACAYASATDASKCDPLAIYDKTKENILILSEIDPGLHAFMEQNKANAAMLTWNAYPGAYETHYFMINGRSMPDTIAPNNAPWLPSQPYGALAHVEPWDAAKNPLDAMLRYVSVGTAGYDFHPHSNHEHVIAEDGALMKGTNGDNNTEEKFNIMVSPGATVDATFRWTNEETYSDTPGNRLPAIWPQGLNLKEGDFWSGSPYLGESGILNAGILTKTQCGEYYHVAHNHDLTEVTNYGITFGGMLTLIKVEPPADVQGTTQGDISVPKCK